MATIRSGWFPEALHPETSSAEIKETNEDCSRRFAELAAEIDQLRLQVQASMNTPSSSSAASNTSKATSNLQSPPSPPLPPAKSQFFFKSTGHLPTFNASNKGNLNRAYIKEVFDFFSKLEEGFGLRNYELQLPARSTEGWVKYAILQLRDDLRNWARFKWGLNPSISWEVFKKSVISTYIPGAAIQQLEREYAKYESNSNSSNIMLFNNVFREFRLLMAFVGKDIPEKTAIEHYIQKIGSSGKPALGLTQLTTAERITEGCAVSRSLEEVMEYCENIYHDGRI